ncbi:hypothetical protein ACJMK2_008387 [Sinanodonta woodiana]|uniref:Uncharacterized protein n=1 Tax=Sinanodonta woodiana TaxID=1069815 RepID=A0ABD3VMP0_SINWO
MLIHACAYIYSQETKLFYFQVDNQLPTRSRRISKYLQTFTPRPWNFLSLSELHQRKCLQELSHHFFQITNVLLFIFFFKKRIGYSSYTGLVERCKISTDVTSVLIRSECKVDKDSMRTLMIICPTIIVGKKKTLCLVIRGASLNIQQNVDLTQNSMDGLVYFCKNLKLCKGRRCAENCQISQSRVRSSLCNVIVSLNFKVELCAPCRSSLNYQNKRKVEDDNNACIVPDIETRENNITPVETASTKLEPNGMVAEAPEIMLTANADNEIDKLFKVVTLYCAPAKFSKADPRHRRWNPDIINLSFSLYSMSPSAYQTLKSSVFFYHTAIQTSFAVLQQISSAALSESKKKNKRGGGILAKFLL